MHRNTLITGLFLASLLLPGIASAQYGGGGGSGPLFPGLSGGGGGGSRGCAPGTVWYPSLNACASTAPVGVSTSTGQVLGAQAYNFTKNLSYGDTGADVSALQQILIADGYLHISAPTGWFGPLTRAAIKEYQAAHGIPATGYVGPLTRASLNQGTLPATSPTSSSSNTGGNLAADIIGAAHNLWGAWESTKAQ